MAAKDGRGGARPGAGRKPVPPEDIARMRRMREVGISGRAIAKTLGYSEFVARKYADKDREDNEE